MPGILAVGGEDREGDAVAVTGAEMGSWEEYVEVYNRNVPTLEEQSA